MDLDKLDHKIYKWLEQHGYPLELRIAKIIQENGYDVTQSLNYEDPEVGGLREIDIIGFKYKNVGNVWFTFSMVVECKSSKKYPWIMFASKDKFLYDASLYKGRYASNNGQLLINKLKKQNLLEELNFFKINELRGFNLIRALTNGGKDAAYTAIKSVTKASEALVLRSNNSFDAICRIYFPVIVIDNRLFECYLDDNSEMKLKETGHSQLILSQAKNANKWQIIDVVTEDYFTKWIQLLNESIEEIYENHEDLLEEVSNEKPTNP